MSDMCSYCLVGFIWIGAYLIGSIPSGYWIAKYWFGVDVTKKGSGNIGATNVSRVLKSKKLFLLIFLLDAIKAFGWLVLSLELLFRGGVWGVLNVLIGAAVFLLIGNAYSLFLHFKGGKGVSTAVGIFGLLAPFSAMAFILVWAISLAIFRRSDTSSLIAIVSIPITHLLFGYGFFPPQLFLFMVCVVGWIFFRHRANIANMV